MEVLVVDVLPQSQLPCTEVQQTDSAKSSETFLGGSCGSRVAFNVIILLCYHNDCFERFDLLFFKEIFYLICRKPPRGGGRTLSSERLPVTAQSRNKPLFYFASLPALQADDSK